MQIYDDDDDDQVTSFLFFQNEPTDGEPRPDPAGRRHKTSLIIIAEMCVCPFGAFDRDARVEWIGERGAPESCVRVCVCVAEHLEQPPLAQTGRRADRQPRRRRRPEAREVCFVFALLFDRLTD